jgi:predicted RNase H-like nuclease (RuvC/YqgF family)
MKLKVTAKPHLKLTKEDEIKGYGEIFEVSDERGIEILKTTFNGETVAEFVPEENTENEALKAEITKLEEEKENLSKENEALKAEIEKLIKKNEEKGKGEK